MEAGPALALLAVLLLVALPVLSLLKVLACFLLSQRLGTAQLATARGKRILITGGSKGLGRAFGLVLAAAGAEVTLAARQSAFLDDAVEQVAQAGSTPVHKIAADLTDGVATRRAIGDACAKDGKFDWVICCAGLSLPGFVADQLSFENNEFDTQMNGNFSTALNTVKAVFSFAKDAAALSKPTPSHSDDTTVTDLETAPLIAGFTLLEATFLPSKIIFCGSVLSFISFLGYGGYAASKYALRGLSDTLRNELKPLNIDIHFMSPGNMDTPGYSVENLTKPDITKKIDGASTLVSPESAAKAHLAGILNNRYAVTNDVIGELMRVANNSSGPRPNPVSEVLSVGLISFIFVVYVYFTDGDVASYYRKQAKLLKSQ
ncbi:3-dehydrosphinganine reductase [Podochytrium sp. JEL0797]|nr:3-dehydrosphinganine reductase [Podochytrium sp. JEL0797]